MKNNINIIIKIKLLFLGVLLSLISLLVIISCGGGSSVGGLNDVLVGNTGGSGGSGGSGSANINPVPFDDLSNDSSATFVDPNNDFDDNDNGLYLAGGALPFNFSLFNNTFNADSDVVFCTNGWFSFDSDIDNDDFDGYDPEDDIDDILVGDSYGPYDSLIAPFWSDLKMDTGIYLGLGLWYETLGSAPNRKFIVQYFATAYGNNDNKLVFQVVLFEGTNDIQFTYAKMEDVNGDDSVGDDGAVDGSGSLIGLFVGNDTSDMNLSVYSAFSSSIPAISTQAYYIYFKYNSSRNNYDIYTGNVAINDLNSSQYTNIINHNLRPNRNESLKNKNRTPVNFRYFYKTNTIQEFMNFVNSIRGNRTNR
ncbi:MAG: hypothetical protein ACP5O4_06505 [bacterium]